MDKNLPRAPLCQRSCRPDRIGTFGGAEADVARYGQRYKDRIVARLLPPESAAIDVVSREVGISVATLERWRADALANGSGGWQPALDSSGAAASGDRHSGDG